MLFTPALGKLLLALLTAAALTAAAVGLIPADPPKPTAPPPPVPDAVAAEKAKLVGEWRVESVDVNGRTLLEAGPDKLVGSKAVITADEFRMRDVSKYTLLPGTTPKGIDLAPQGGPPAGRKTVAGVYKLEGDALTLHVPIDAAPRPADFECAPDTATMLLVLKRLRPDVVAEKARLIGEWRVSAGTTNQGRKGDQNVGKSMTFAADSVELVSGAKAAYTLDPAATPKRLDLILAPGDRGTTVPGIYKVDGDTLTVHLSVGPAPGAGLAAARPKDFAPTAASLLFVLDRVKPAAVEDVADAWLPAIRGAKVQKFGGRLDYDGRRGVAAHTFDITGASFADVWDFYAAKCGTKHRFDPKTFDQLSWTGAKDSPSSKIQDREVGLDPASGRRGDHLTTFTYRDRVCVVTVTIHPKRDGSDAIVGALTVVLLDAAR